MEEVEQVDEVDVHGKYYAPYPLLCTPTPADDFVIRNAPHHCLQPQHHGSNQCFGVFCRVVRHRVCKVKGVNKGVKGEQGKVKGEQGKVNKEEKQKTEE